MLGYSVPNDMSVPSSQCCAWDILQNFLRICEKEPVFAPEISRSGRSEERYIDPQRQWQTLSEHLLQDRYTTTQFPRAGQRKSWRSSVSKNEDSYACSGHHYWCDKAPTLVTFLADVSHLSCHRFWRWATYRPCYSPRGLLSAIAWEDPPGGYSGCQSTLYAISSCCR